MEYASEIIVVYLGGHRDPIFPFLRWFRVDNDRGRQSTALGCAACIWRKKTPGVGKREKRML